METKKFSVFSVFSWFTVLSYNAFTVHGGYYNNLASQRTAVGRCRSSCLEKYAIRSKSQLSLINACTSRFTWKCHMCWDYCDMLSVDENIAQQMCADDVVCFEGCKYACKIYQRDFRNVIQSKMDTFKIEYSKDLISWKPTTKSKNVVYVVLGLAANKKWKEIDQTTTTSVTPDDPSKLVKVLVLAVDAKTTLALGKSIATFKGGYGKRNARI